ncbi:MAG: hypothetical protein DSY42_09555 [Aquifex sp.]|nr:MAG: hypothetical protein DSY42_09555 [Aquifex sp.]
MQTSRIIKGFGYEPYVFDINGEEKPLYAYNGKLTLGYPEVPVSSYQFPEALTPDKTISVTYNSTNGTIVVDENQRFLVGDRLYNSSDYDITKRTFKLSPSTVYHLRFTTSGKPLNNFTPPHKGFYLVSLSDVNYNPNSLPLRAEEWNRSDDFVIADIITDANGIPTIYKRKLDRLEKFKEELEKRKITVKEVWVDPSGDDRNDGSQEAPLRTLDGALLKPGYTTYTAWGTEEVKIPFSLYIIYLTPGYTYDLSKVIALSNSFVLIVGDLQNPPIIDNPSGGNIRLRWASLEFFRCTIKNTGGNLFAGNGGVASRISFSSSTVNIGTKNLIGYYIHQHFHVALGSSTVVKTSTGLLVNCNGSSLDYYRDNSTTIQDSAGNTLTDTDIIGGIVRDVNGVPRNVRSNIVL